MGTIIEVHDLVKRFGDLTAVDQVSFAVNEGEVFGLLGPNGAGKSTIIKMLTTLLPPTSGSASVAGFDVIKQQMAVRRCIGYVPQALSADGNGIWQGFLPETAIRTAQAVNTSFI